MLATQPILGSVRSKLGLVTQAFFAQKDFSKLEILDVRLLNTLTLQTLFQNLTLSIKPYPSDNTLYMGLSLREMIHTFKHKILVLFKALLLEKRILFFGQKVERLSTYQYGLVSLVPELLRHIEDVGSPSLDIIEAQLPNQADVSDAEYASKSRLLKMGFPLCIFGEVS